MDICKKKLNQFTTVCKDDVIISVLKKQQKRLSLQHSHYRVRCDHL